MFAAGLTRNHPYSLARPAILKLVVTTDESGMPLATIRKLNAIVPANLTDEEAKRNLCELRPVPWCR
jgi:hypothetical protein